MDKIIDYIEWRMKKYGNCDKTVAESSVYYHFGETTVRVSDHMTFSADRVDNNDYYFIIQPNDMYIFAAAPKHNSDNRLRLKIVTYQEAKNFIKSLHDSAININNMTIWYNPEEWKTDVLGGYEPDTKYTWKEFFDKYMSGNTDQKQFGICNRIETLYYGVTQKGVLADKLPKMEALYNGLSDTQYAQLIMKTEA